MDEIAQPPPPETFQWTVDPVKAPNEPEEVEIGFNVNYLLDALSAIDGAEVEVGLTDGNSSCLIRAPGTTNTKYVVMPMRL